MRCHQGYGSTSLQSGSESRYSFSLQRGSRSGSESRDTNQCGSMRMQIRILVRLYSLEKLHLYMKNILIVGRYRYSIKNIPYLRSTVKAFLKGNNQVYLLIWLISVILDPDTHSYYRSGSRTAKSKRIQNNA